MGNRLSRIATRTGDDGTTGLSDGSRLHKDHLRIQSLGDVDELNSTLGLLMTEPLPEEVHVLLTSVQNELFNLGAELSLPGKIILQESALEQLDAALLYFNSSLTPLAEFILPGGTRAAALAHVARTVARRAERTVVALGRNDKALQSTSREYLNRLSDLLFVIARVLNRVGSDEPGRNEIYWQSQRLVKSDPKTDG